MSDSYNCNNAKIGYKYELRHSSFERHFQLPDYIEGDPEAKLKDGLLTLKWNLKNKDKPISENKQIPILT